VTVRSRSVAAGILAVIGTACLFVGALYAWAAPTLFDSQKFAVRARAALDDSPALRQVVARTLVVEVIERNRADLIAFRPVLIAAADTVVRSDTFGDAFEVAVRQSHELFTEEPSDSLAVRVDEAAVLLVDTLRIVAPQVADQIPDNFRPALVRFRHASTELELWHRADRARVLAFLLPVVGVLAWGGVFVLSADRRRTLVRLGIVLTVAGVVLLSGVRIGGQVVPAQFDLPVNREAAHDVWATFTEGLVAIGWLAVLGGILLAAAVQAITRDESRLSPARMRTWLSDRLTVEPRSRWGRVGAGVVAGGVGLALFTSPLAVAETLLMLVGAFVVYAALVYVLDALVLPTEAPADGATVPTGPRRRAWAIGVAGSLGLLLVAGVVTYLVVSEPESTERVAGCNGRIEYCLRRLDQVALPTTHNAPTAAEDGFLLPNQERGVIDQLRDGVRGFQIDTYLGSVETGAGSGWCSPTSTTTSCCRSRTPSAPS